MVMAAAVGMWARHQTQCSTATTICATGIKKAHSMPTATPLATASCCSRHSCASIKRLAHGLSQGCWESCARSGAQGRASFWEDLFLEGI